MWEKSEPSDHHLTITDQDLRSINPERPSSRVVTVWIEGEDARGSYMPLFLLHFFVFLFLFK